MDGWMDGATKAQQDVAVDLLQVPRILIHGLYHDTAILTLLILGPYYKFRTYQDWLEEKNMENIDSKKPFWEKVRPVPITLACFVAFSHYFSIQVELIQYD